MKEYIFWTKNDNEGIRMHEIKADSCKKAYELLKKSGYDSKEITLTGYKVV